MLLEMVNEWFPVEEIIFAFSCVWSLHRYIHNWPLQPFGQDYGLASHTTHVAYVNFIHEWQHLQFNVDSEQQIFKKLFHGRFIYSQSFCQKLLRENRRRNNFCFHISNTLPNRLRRLHIWPSRQSILIDL